MSNGKTHMPKMTSFIKPNNTCINICTSYIAYMYPLIMCVCTVYECTMYVCMYSITVYVHIRIYVYM